MKKECVKESGKKTRESEKERERERLMRKSAEFVGAFSPVPFSFGRNG